MFVHLHVHSNYSFCRGADRLETLVIAARQRGYTSLALTDTNGLYGLGWFLDAAREAGLRPIVGAEAVYGAERAVVLVKDREGYAGLCRLLTRIHRALATPVAGGHGVDVPRTSMAGGTATNGSTSAFTLTFPAVGCSTRGGQEGWDESLCASGPGRGDPLPPVTITARPARRAPDPRFSLAAALMELPAGVVILSPCPALLERLARARGTRDLYVELRPGAAPSLRAFARATGLPPVATGGVYFVEREGRRRHHLLRAIALNTALDRVPPEELAPPDAFLATPDEIARRFPDLPQALEASVRIAEQCTFVPERGRPIFPVYETLDGLRLEGDEVSNYLEAACREGILRRYGAITEEARRRLARELGIIRGKGFAPYFLVVRDIVRQAPRTCGRGSAAASLVSYALGITHVDPIRYDLFFDRFLNPGRVDPPDIDVDFPWDERDRLLEWVFTRFGRHRAAMIANHNTFQARAAVREIAKVLGLPDEEIGRITKRLPWHSAGEAPADLVRTHPLFKDVVLEKPWPFILSAARELDGFPRHLSVHCGGVVLVPDAIDRYVPVQPAAKGVDVIQWEKDQAEDSGLVKIDLLGNRSLAVIRDACAAIASHGGPAIVFERFQPLDDPRTQELLARGDTLGVFYVESPAMRQLQIKCGTGSFERLVVHSSIIRPAANEYIREYIRRLKGGAYRSIHPILDGIMGESFGIMVYQEDVAKTVIAMAGFDAASADDLRKVLARKHKERRLADYRKRFFEGASERGFADEVVADVWRMILSFAGYSFCKPHSASYALVSFKSAWLRAHHPAEFIAAVIANGGGYYSTFAYISEARRMGLQVLLPDVNASERAYTGWSADVREPRPGDSTTAGGLAACQVSAAGPSAPSYGRDGAEPQQWPGPHAQDDREAIGAHGGALPGPAGSDEPGKPGKPGHPGEPDQRDSGLAEHAHASAAQAAGAARGGARRPGAAPKAAPARGVVRVGFQQLKGFPAAAIDALLDERRRGGPFRSFEEFLERAGDRVGAAGAKILVRGGAFDALAGGLGARPSLMWRLAAWQSAHERQRANGRPLWDMEETSALPPPPCRAPYDERHVLRQEVEALGFLISRHPLALYEREIASLGRCGGPPLVAARDLRRHAGRPVKLVGWYVTAKTVHTKKGEPMEFLSFEDTTALYEATFFPRVYARFCHLMSHERPYVVEGKVEQDDGAIAVTVDEVAFLGSAVPARLAGGEPSATLAPPRPPHRGGVGPDWSKLIEGA